MSCLYVMVGIPGSGKSTFANSIANAIVVSSDKIRGELYGDENIQGNPKEVFAEVDKRVQSLLDDGFDVVYDATNIDVALRKDIIKRFNCSKYFCVFMNTPVAECLKRNKLRDRKVPDSVIYKMANRLKFPSAREGFDRVFIINK